MEENNSLKRKIILKENENISKKKKIVDSHANNIASYFEKNKVHV